MPSAHLGHDLDLGLGLGRPLFGYVFRQEDLSKKSIGN